MKTPPEVQRYDVIGSFSEWMDQGKTALVGALVIPVVLMILLFILLLLVFGVAYNNNPRLGNLVVHCVNLDQPGPVATAFLAFCTNISEGGNSDLPTLKIANYTDFEAAVDGVNDGDTWGFIILNNGTSAKLSAEVRKAAMRLPTNDSYNASEAFTILYDEGRNSNTQSMIVIPFLTALTGRFIDGFSDSFWKSQFNTTFATRPASTLIPYMELIRQPISYSILNLHKTTPVGNFALSMGVIYLVVFSFTTLLVGGSRIRILLWSIKPMWQRWIFGILLCIYSALWISLGFSAVLAIYSAVPPYRFVACWMLCTLFMVINMLSLSICVPLVHSALPLLFLFYLFFNLCAIVFNLQIQNPFYQWGYATPAWHAVTALRTILYDSYDKISLNVPVLMAMFGSSAFITIPLVMIFVEYVLRPRGWVVPPEGYKISSDGKTLLSTAEPVYYEMP